MFNSFELFVHYLPYIITDVLWILVSVKWYQYTKTKYTNWIIVSALGAIGVLIKSGSSIIETLAAIFGWWAVG